MGNPRNVGGIRARAGRGPQVAPSHYLTSRETAVIARQQRDKDEARGIFRRWNDRLLTPEETARARTVLRRLRRLRRRRPSPPAPAADQP